jgi:hypothetical protein
MRADGICLSRASDQQKSQISRDFHPTKAGSQKKTGIITPGLNHFAF